MESSSNYLWPWQYMHVHIIIAVMRIVGGDIVKHRFVNNGGIDSHNIICGTLCWLVNIGYRLLHILADLAIPIKTIFPRDAWYSLLPTRPDRPAVWCSCSVFWQASYALFGMISGPILGIFTLGMINPWSNKFVRPNTTATYILLITGYDFVTAIY